MALFYIMDHDNDGAADRYRLHDIVDICDDCTVQLPPAPPFMIVKVSGVTKAQAMRFLDTHYLFDDPANARLGRRKYKLDVPAIPAAWKNALLANRYNECTLAQARKFILNKVAGLHDDGT